jgi:hypothetical protein
VEIGGRMQITRDRLRDALGSNLGCVLTPELAAMIEHLATDRADNARDPASFEPRAYGGLVFQVESFRDILPELEDLHQQHFAETEQHLRGVALNPNYTYMANRERNGTLIQFTARAADGTLAGNLRMYLGESLHTGRQFAEEDTFYLLPEYRKGATALSFLRYAEEALVGMVGVVEVRANSKIVNQAHRLMEYRGYRHVANQYVKLFEKE